MHAYETRIFGKISGLKSNKKGASGIYGFHIHGYVITLNLICFIFQINLYKYI